MAVLSHRIGPSYPTHLLRGGGVGKRAMEAAFREALGSLTGTAKAGLIGSIALRGDSTARYALAGIKDNPVEAAVVREAATRALAYLANAKA